MKTRRKNLMTNDRVHRKTFLVMGILLMLATILTPGCNTAEKSGSARSQDLSQRQFSLEKASPQRVMDILSRLGLDTVSVVPDGNAIELTADPNELEKAGVVIHLVDTAEPYVMETLAPVSAARALPSNRDIARFLEDLPIGTFAAPPSKGATHGAIVDIHRGHVIAIVPQAAAARLMKLVRQNSGGRSTPQGDELAADRAGGDPGVSRDGPAMPSAPGVQETSSRPRVRLVQPADTSPKTATASPQTADAPVPSSDRPAAASASVVGTEAGSPAGTADLVDPNRYEQVPIPNGDEVLTLDLPEQLEIAQLLELVGEYLHLDYLYEPEKIKGTVLLRLHGKLQGQMQVRDLYGLLESVLRFRGLVMTCHKNNLVTIVPAAEALQASPSLIDSDNRNIQTGDMVVTSIFELKNIAVPAAAALLENMKLSLAVTPAEGSRSLIVTCYAHQIDRIERLLRVVDRAGPPREFQFRQLQYTMAESLTRKIQILMGRMGKVAVAGGAAQTNAKPAAVAGGTGSADDAVYLDADDRTNRILIIGYAEQIALANKLIDSLDIAQQDLRVLKVYDLRYVDAEEVKNKLQELEIIGVRGGPRAVGAAKIEGTQTAEAVVAEDAVVVPIEATNSLAINATEEQHARIEAMLTFLDAEIRNESIPYEIYFLENQDPAALADVIEKIINETVQDKEGKVQKVLRNTDDQILIVPDKNTFSLIVYADRKNQEWISKLIKTLDRRRPQVLIDVTLVEIRKTDEFNYDLNMITSFPDLTDTGGQTGQFYADDKTTVVDKLLQSDRSQYVDFKVASGAGTGFYADRHINALLTAVQTKNYGRVLAKPKVLVNDNEKGSIKTADTTYVETRSSIPVTSGAAGQQNTLIETEVKYEPYDAGITLEITPHISDGQLLRLEISLNRSDFTSLAGTKPPDETSSDIVTTVTVPDSSTIILGGMLKLNQSKASSKVPILGDLPLVGGLFRSIDNSDIQSKLYVFVRAEIIRPADIDTGGSDDLKRISDENRRAFEKHEQEFQGYQSWPGIKAQPVDPPKVLEAR
jgi:type II secretory pathway component GspD/PulD (secretin)